MVLPKRLSTITVLLALIGIVTGQSSRVVFSEDSERSTHYTDDAITVEALPSPAESVVQTHANGEPNTRFFPGLFSGVVGGVSGGIIGGVLGGLKHKEVCLTYCSVGNPQLSSQCCRVGHYHCCKFVNGFVQPGAVGPGFGGLGAYPIGGFGAYGGLKPGQCPGIFGNVGNQLGYRPAFGGFRNMEGDDNVDGKPTEEQNAKQEEGVQSRRKRQDSTVHFPQENEDDSDVNSKKESSEANVRFLGAFAPVCQTDLECPGQLKCCGDLLKNVCKQPVFFLG